MMTKKRIAAELKILKEKLKVAVYSGDKDMILRQIISLKSHGLMLLKERDDNNQHQYTDGTIMYHVNQVSEFYKKENGKIGLRSNFRILPIFPQLPPTLNQK